MAWSVLYFGVKHPQDAQAERKRALAADLSTARLRNGTDYSTTSSSTALGSRN